ncbi:MAG TPA: hypothetical protein PLJ78_07510 [Anaerolineae bacterium]|nr:hypothetical protein [Anaerolineae bacterium]HQK13770.1 hypothetical protein [Anaerolineae bacterium]
MKRYYVFGMTLVLLVAAGLRLGALPDWPVGLHYDEAANVILTRQIAAGEYRPVFIRAYTGKEVLFFYAGAFWVWATGGAPWGLRLNAAMLGTLTVAATYAATRALFGPERRARWIALLAAGWVAVAFPHVLLSRYGFRAISQPLLQALTVAALWHGLRTGKRAWLVAGGACLGLTGYTYLAARLFPIPLTLALAWLLFRTPREARLQRMVQLGLTLLVAVIVFAPLGLYFIRHPDAFTTRINQVAAPTWRDALRGLWLCLRALVWPGDGDPYIRFNLPGRPVLDGPAAVLAVFGLMGLLFTPRKDTLTGAGRCFILAALAIMLLPSALATSEITPSNLRLIGLFPFIAILPAQGVVLLLDALKEHLLSKSDPTTRRAKFLSSRRSPPAPCPLLPASCLFLILLLGGVSTGHAYRQWGASLPLFYAADGEMVLAAQALETLDTTHTTVYIASEHFRHPTVAALAQQYPQAKWLTGGATLVLPPTGDAVYLWPRSLMPPGPWPEALAARWQVSALNDPGGKPTLWIRRLSASDIAALRPTPPPAADFAHVVQVYNAQAASVCRVGEPCPILLTWAVNAPYTTLQPVVRLLHPQTGEWVRETAFHYPPEQWTLGDIVFDQLTLVPPIGIPPVDGYQIGVGFFNPDGGEVLPRLEAERFAGLEARFPLTPPLLPSASVPDAAQTAAACLGIPRDAGITHGMLQLLGHTSLPGTMRPGEALTLRLCWQATGTALPQDTITLTLSGPETHVLYSGPPANGYAFAQWRAGDIVEDRHTLRLPRALAAGQYTLTLSVGNTALTEVGNLTIQAVERTFTPPDVPHPFTADFGASVRLLGYDVGTLAAGQPLEVTLYWQALAEMTEDYLVFVHLLDMTSGRIIAQVDEAPQHNGYPTSLWLAGEIVTDRHTLAIPADLSDGDYALRIGFYRQEDGTYLAVNGNASLLIPGVQ